MYLCTFTGDQNNLYLRGVHATSGEWVHFQGKQLFHFHFCLPSEWLSPFVKLAKKQFNMTGYINCHLIYKSTVKYLNNEIKLCIINNAT